MASQLDEGRAARRRPTNISLPVDLVSAAKSFGINVSKACEAGLDKAIRQERTRQWQKEHRDVIEDCNAWIEKNGLPFSNLPPL